MKSSLLRMVVVAAVIAILTPGSTLVAQQPQPKASDAHVTDLMNQALHQLNAVQNPYGAPQPAAGPVADLRLEDAVARAMDQNIDLAVARLGPQLQDLSLAQTRSAYRPTVGATFGDASRASMATSTISGAAAGAVTSSQTYTYNGSLNQVVPWTGGSASLTWNNNRAFTDSNNFTVNPSFTSSFNAQITQPLWQNFRIDSTRNSLWTGLISRQIADVTLRASVVNTEASTRIAYWNLVYAVQNVQIQRDAVGLAEQFVKDNQAKVDVGTLAPLDVIQAQSNLAAARQRLVAAQQTREQNEIALKRLIVGSTQDPLWTATINPTDRPEPPTQAAPIDIKGAIANALDKRTDLITARQTLRQSDITLKYNKNQTLPRADLTASYGTQGTGGDVYSRSLVAGGTPTLLQPGGYLDALSILRRAQVPSWNMSVTFSYPIGTSSADASYARAKVQYQQSLTQLKSAELRVATDVTQAALNVQSNLQQVETARAARELAQKQLEAEQSKFEVGMETNYFVVQAQQALAAAQVSELQALLNYRISLVTFQQVQETGSASVSGVSSSSGGSSSTSSGSTGGQ